MHRWWTRTVCSAVMLVMATGAQAGAAQKGDTLLAASATPPAPGAVPASGAAKRANPALEVQTKLDYESASSTGSGKGTTKAFGRWGFALIPNGGPFSSYEVKGYRTDDDKTGLTVDGGYIAAIRGPVKVVPLRLTTDRSSDEAFNTGAELRWKKIGPLSNVMARPLWVNMNRDGEVTGSGVRTMGSLNTGGVIFPFGYDYEFRTEQAHHRAESNAVFAGAMRAFGRLGAGVSYGRDYAEFNRLYVGVNDKHTKYGLLSQVTWRNGTTDEYKGEVILAQNASNSNGPEGVISHQERYTIGEEAEDRRRSSTTANKSKGGWTAKFAFAENTKREYTYAPEFGYNFGAYGLSIGRMLTEVGEDLWFVTPSIKQGDLYLEGNFNRSRSLVYMLWSPTIRR